MHLNSHYRYSILLLKPSIMKHPTFQTQGLELKFDYFPASGLSNLVRVYYYTAIRRIYQKQLLRLVVFNKIFARACA
jgi:hypothetical protein